MVRTVDIPRHYPLMRAGEFVAIVGSSVRQSTAVGFAWPVLTRLHWQCDAAGHHQPSPRK